MINNSLNRSKNYLFKNLALKLSLSILIYLSKSSKYKKIRMFSNYFFRLGKNRSRNLHSSFQKPRISLQCILDPNHLNLTKPGMHRYVNQYKSKSLLLLYINIEALKKEKCFFVKIT